MSFMRLDRLPILFCLFSMIGFCELRAFAADPEPNSVTAPAESAPAPNLAASQESIEIRYRRFEGTLLQLSEYLRKADPARAELLLRASGKSKEGRIPEQLQNLTELLKKDQLGDAVERQELVVVELQSLLELLMSEARKDDLDREKKRVQELIKDVNKLIGKETDARANTERGGDSKDLQDQQKQVADSAKKLTEKITAQDAEKRASKNDSSKSDKDADQTNKSDKKDSDKEGNDSDDKKGPDSKDGDKPKSDGKDDSSKKSDGEKKTSDPKMKDDAEQKSDDASKPGDPKNGKPESGKSGKTKKSQKGESQDGKPKSSKSKDGKPQQGKPQDGKPQDGKPQDGEQPQDGKEQQNPSEQQDQQQQPEDSKEKSGKTAGRDEIERARQEMNRAIEELKKNNKKGASDKQDKAIAELMKAKEKLEEILRQLREEELELVLVKLESRFRDMLQKQETVNNGTLSIHGVPVDNRTDRHRNRSVELARNEDAISLLAAKSLTLLKEEGSSIAFPEAVEQIRDDMLTVSRRLDRVDVGEITQNIEQDIVEGLKEIIEALQKEIEKAKDKKQQPQQKQQQQQDQQKQGLVNKLAELKMLRSLQFRVNRRTKQLGRLVDGEQAVDPDVVSQLKQLSERQSKVQHATYDLSTGKNQ